jgi:16S rRNA processing protein RimM
VGLECLLPEEELSQLEENKYYLFEVVGSSVFTESRQHVGVVSDVLFIKDNDLLVIQRGAEEILIPFTISICASINLEKREIVIKPPKGLLDLNEI